MYKALGEWLVVTSIGWWWSGLSDIATQDKDGKWRKISKEKIKSLEMHHALHWTVKTPLCLRSLWASFINPYYLLSETISWCFPWGSLRQRGPFNMKKQVAELRNNWQSLLDISSSCSWISRKRQISQIHSLQNLAFGEHVILEASLVCRSGSVESREREYIGIWSGSLARMQDSEWEVFLQW